MFTLGVKFTLQQVDGNAIGVNGSHYTSTAIFYNIYQSQSGIWLPGGGARLTVFHLLLGVKPLPEPKTPIIPFGLCLSVLGRPFT